MRFPFISRTLFTYNRLTLIMNKKTRYLIFYFLWCILLTSFMANRASAYLTKPLPSYKPGQEAPIFLETKGSHKLILADEGDQKSDYSISIHYGAPLRMATESLPLNIAIVIDRSGSMADKGKIEFAKTAAKTFLQQLNSKDRVALLEYDDQVEVLSPSTLIGENRESLLKKIDLIETRGATNLSGGMSEGAKQIEKFTDDNHINRVLLLSDGLANTGIADLPGVTRLVEALANKGIQVTTFGLGADFDEEMMTRIADSSGGNYYFIAGATQIAGLFEKERKALSTVVAKKVRLTLDIGNKFVIDQVYGYPFRKQGEKIIVELPDIYSGQNRKVIFSLKPKLKEGTNIPVATATLEYTAVSKSHPLRKEEATITASITRDKSVYEKSANADVMAESAKAVSAQKIQEAMKSYSSGNVGGANSLLNNARSTLQQAYQSTGNPSLKKQLDELNQTSTIIQSQPADSEEGKLFIKEKKSEARDQQQAW